MAFYADGSHSPISGCGATSLTVVSGATYQAVCQDSTLPAGTHAISATYSGDTDYATSSGSLSPEQSVQPAPTSFSVTANSTSSVSIPFGTTATLAESGLPTGATGTVTFTSGSTPLCSFSLPSTSCTTSSTLPAGTYSAFSATFADTDGNYSGSTSTNTITLTVVPDTTTTTLSTSDSPSTYGQSVTFTATVSPTDGGGTVAFYADGSHSPISGCGATSLTVVSGATYQAACQDSTLPAGTHAISATYSGDTDYATSSGSLSPEQSVNQQSLTITASNASMAYGTTPPSITPSYMGFVLGQGSTTLTTQPTCTTAATSSSTVAGSPYQSTCSGAVDPNYQFTYIHGSVTVQPAATSFSATVDSGSSATVSFGTSATLAEAGLPAGATGTVSFTSGSTTLCSFSLPSTSCTTSPTLPDGTYPSIGGTFSDTDGNYDGSNSTNSVSLTDNALAGSPVAEDSTYGTDFQATLTVDASQGILENDTMNGATISSHSSPSDGTLTLNDDGSFIYVPNESFSGTDKFTYLLENSFGTSEATITINVAPPKVASLVQLYGPDAIGTAIALSNREFAAVHSAEAVVLARDDFFADALAGGPLAAAMDGPLLLTPPASQDNALDPRVLAEIERVLPVGDTVYILGGDLAISPDVDTTLKGLGYHVVREAGANEYATAVDIAKQLGNPPAIFEATGLSFSDALSAVPAAIAVHGAILLTEGATQAPETAAYLAQHGGDVRYAIGGPLAAYGADPTATPVYGQDIFGTSAAVAREFFPDASDFAVATASDFADALTGGVFIGTQPKRGPILVVDPSGALPSSIVSYLGNLPAAAQGYIVGGPLAVPASVISALQSVIG